MLHTHPEYLVRLDRVKRKEAVRRAEVWRSTRAAMAGRRGWLSQQGCWLLCRLGRLLVRWGQRLQAYGTPQIALKIRG
jgi:hypothetical protein